MITRGQVLLTQGRYVEGIRMARNAFKEGIPQAGSRATLHLLLAMSFLHLSYHAQATYHCRPQHRL